MSSSAIVHKQQHGKPHIFQTVFKSLIICLSLAIAALIFSFNRKLVDIYLTFKIGKCYGGLICTEDMFFLIPASKNPITAVIYIRTKEKCDMVNKISQLLQEKVFDYPDNYSKLTSTTHRFGGYFYRKKYQCILNDAVKTIEVEERQELSEEFLKKYTAKVNTDEYGKNGTMLWEMHVAPQPLVSDEPQSTYTYPLIARFHHSIADGTSLVSWFMQLFGDKSGENYCKDIFRTIQKSRNVKEHKSSSKWMVFTTITNLLKTIIFYLEIFIISFGRVAEKNQFKPNDVNALHANKYVEEKICAWAVEDKAECITIVKNIKNRENTGFTCVLATAITASLSHYFKRNGLPIPEFISAAITFLSEYPDENTSKPIPLKNKTGALIINLPMIYGSTTLSKLLRNVCNAWKQLRPSDAWVSKFSLLHLCRIQFQVAKQVLGFKSHTLLLTNVPGGSKITTSDGYVCEKIIPLAPNFEGMGISIAILSYDEKLHIGVLVDKALVKSQEEVQKIADDVFFYIKLLDSETNKL